MTLLQAPFVLKTRNEQQKGAFTNLLKFLTLFNIQLLRRMQLIDEKVHSTLLNFFCFNNIMPFS
jgi:hypothetical protein